VPDRWESRREVVLGNLSVSRCQSGCASAAGAGSAEVYQIAQGYKNCCSSTASLTPDETNRSQEDADRLRTVQRPDHHAAEKRSRFEHRMGRVMVRLGSGILARSKTNLATAQLRFRWDRPAQQDVDEQPQSGQWW
jgi:hypothetical protein